MMHKKLSGLAIIPWLVPLPLATLSFTCYAESLETAHPMSVEVIEDLPDNTYESTLTTTKTTQPHSDAGELLRSVNGVSSTRRSGHGFDPIIRGQQKSQLNILSDGGFIVSACPARMDPATSYTGMETFDEVTVIKGNRSVIYGSGGSGGTVIFSHQRPEFAEGRDYQGKVTLGYKDNSETTSGSADLAAGGSQGFIRAYIEKTSANNYEDGDGNKVSSQYDSLTRGLLAGWDVSSADYLQFGLEQSRQEDVYYAGNGMDSPFANADSLRAKWEHTSPIGPVDEFELNLYRTDADHHMDNYTVRVRNPMMRMAAPSSTDSWGGRWLGRHYGEQSEWRFGFDYRASDQQATRYMDNDDSFKNGYAMPTSILWPDAELRNTGIFTEVDYQINSRDMLRAGIRIDHWSADATAADSPYSMMPVRTPDQLYQTYYGNGADKRSENEVSLVAGWDRDLEKHTRLSVNFSRTARSPDATELYIASDRENMMGHQIDWVGNPDLDAEIHHQFDVTIHQENQLFSWSATVFYDHVEDFIERYQAGSGMDSILKYKNVQARLSGFELEGQYRLTSRLLTRATVAYTRGVNTDEDTDLAQISPLEGHFYLDYEEDDLTTGIEWVVANQQDKVNKSSGFDAGETSGFGVLHWHTSYQLLKGLKLKAGVENIFDKTYAYHVNSANFDPFSTDAIRVNEPGRQFWLKGEYQF